VKTAKKPTFLAVPVEDIVKDMAKGEPKIYILAELLNAEQDRMKWDAELLVWNWASKLAKAPTRTFPPFTILNHCIPRNENRDIYELLALCNREWQRGA
jgi:hypothetical protein